MELLGAMEMSISSVISGSASLLSRVWSVGKPTVRDRRLSRRKKIASAEWIGIENGVMLHNMGFATDVVGEVGEVICRVPVSLFTATC